MNRQSAPRPGRQRLLHGRKRWGGIHHEDCRVMTAARILGATRPGSQQPSCIVRLWLCGLRGAWPPCLGPRHCGPPPSAPREAELHLLAGPCRNQCTRMRTLAGRLPPRPRRRRGGREGEEQIQSPCASRREDRWGDVREEEPRTSWGRMGD